MEGRELMDIKMITALHSVLTEHVSYDAQPRWCDKSFVCKAQFDCPPQPHGIVPFREYMIPYMSKIQTLFPAPIGCAVKLN